MSIVTYGYSRQSLTGTQQIVTGPGATVVEDQLTLIVQTQNLTLTATTGQVSVS